MPSAVDLGMPWWVIREWTADPAGHGGQRRSAQVDDFWKRVTGARPTDTLVVRRRRTRSILTSSNLRCYLRAQTPGQWRFVEMLQFLPYAEIWRNLNRLPSSRPWGVVIEATRGHMLCRMLRHKASAIVAIPHNIEALAPKAFLPKRPTGTYLLREMGSLRSANLTVTISEFDNILAENFGVEATTVKYIPGIAERGKFSLIRQARATSKKRHILVNGSASNPSTCAGIEALLESLKGDARNVGHIVVAGYRTEKFRNFEGDNITVMGTVDEATLTRLYIEASVSVANQKTGTGLLTRIAENICCGLPTLGNSLSIRGYERVPGVYVYNGARELRELLNAELTAPDDRALISEVDRQVGELERRVSLLPSTIGAMARSWGNAPLS